MNTWKTSFRAVLLAVLTAYFAWSPIAAQHDENFIADYLTKWESSMDYLIQFAELMPAEHYGFKPTPEQRSFAEQINHVCGNVLWLSNDYLGGKELAAGEYDTHPTEKAEVIALLKKAFEHARETVENFNADDLDDQVQFFAGPMSKRKVFFLMSDHVTHHRGQLVVYLRLKGIEPPAYRGW